MLELLRMRPSSASIDQNVWLQQSNSSAQSAGALVLIQTYNKGTIYAESGPDYQESMPDQIIHSFIHPKERVRNLEQRSILWNTEALRITKPLTPCCSIYIAPLGGGGKGINTKKREELINSAVSGSKGLISKDSFITPPSVGHKHATNLRGM